MNEIKNPKELLDYMNVNIKYKQDENWLLSKCENGYGNCFDQVELEREWFAKKTYEFKTIFIWFCLPYQNDYLTHAYLVYKENDNWVYFENADENKRGLHIFETLEDLIFFQKETFIKENEAVGNKIDEKIQNTIKIYEYEKPKQGITFEEFIDHIINSKEITNIINNKPLYFYHLVPKNANMGNGLISLKYMYDNKMYEDFDKSAIKYKERITSSWNIEKFKGKKELSREDYIEALEIFRGDNGASYIYFFRYPPKETLGKHMKEILKEKDIYRININDEEVKKQIEYIFYGYENSHSDNRLLDKKYYETISINEYFKNYDDESKMNFAALNHIGIIFKEGRIDLKYLEKIK